MNYKATLFKRIIVDLEAKDIDDAYSKIKKLLEKDKGLRVGEISENDN